MNLRYKLRDRILRKVIERVSSSFSQNRFQGAIDVVNKALALNGLETKTEEELENIWAGYLGNVGEMLDVYPDLNALMDLAESQDEIEARNIHLYEPILMINV
jgi:hypothetical protein